MIDQGQVLCGEGNPTATASNGPRPLNVCTNSRRVQKDISIRCAQRDSPRISRTGRLRGRKGGICHCDIAARARQIDIRGISLRGGNGSDDCPIHL